jgi:hypothetical protein
MPFIESPHYWTPPGWRTGDPEVLGTVRRETITDPDFYNQFFSLAQDFVDQEQPSQAGAPAIVHPAPI